MTDSSSPPSAAGPWQKRVATSTIHTPESLATALCDAGLVHVNEQRIIINGVSFYPSDFWTERKAQLDGKITAAEFSNYPELVIISSANEIHYPDRDELNRTLDTLRKTIKDPKEHNKRMAEHIRYFGDDILTQFREGNFGYIFTADTPSREQDMWPSDRNYAIGFLSKLPASHLEYLLHCSTELHLDTRWEDECKMVGKKAKNQFWFGSMTGISNRLSPGSKKPLSYTNITIGGLEARATTARFFLSHELGHIVFRNTQIQPKESAALHFWQASYHALKSHLATLDKSDQTAFNAFCPPATFTYSNLGDHETGLGQLLLDEKNLYEDHKKEAEAFCNSLALHGNLNLSEPIEGMSVQGSAIMQEHLAQLTKDAQAVLKEELARVRSASPHPLSPTSGPSR